jgi:hypothetical protein
MARIARDRKAKCTGLRNGSSYSQQSQHSEGESMIDIKDKQTIYDAIQEAKGDGKEQITLQHNKAIKQQHTQHLEDIEEVKKQYSEQKEKKEGVPTLSPSDLLSDKQALRVRVMADLLEGSSKGNAQASDKLAKIAGIENDISELQIITETFKDVPIECPSCGANVHQRPLKQAK